MPRKAVFLDRDDTLIEDPGYIHHPSLVRLLAGAGRAVAMLRQAGYAAVVVSNQSGIARGMFSEQDLAAVHEELRRQLAADGAAVDAIYYCPYHPDGTVEPYAAKSDLRKPAPGMLLQAAREMDLDLAASWMVGDSDRDVLAGKRAGCRTVRIVRPGQSVGPDEAQADHTAASLLDAARLILAAGQ